MDPKLEKVAHHIRRHQEEARKLWSSLDRSESGTLGRLALCLMVREIMPDVTKYELRRLLLRIMYETDGNLDGLIHFQELQQVCSTLAHPRRPQLLPQQRTKG